MSREIMQQALDHLVSLADDLRRIPSDIAQTIAALEAALAQPEQDYIKKLEDDFCEQLDQLSERNYKLRMELADAKLAQPEQKPKLSDAGADTNIPLWGLKPKGNGMVTFHQPNLEHQPWCDYLNIVLTSMPPQRANCNCKNPYQPEQDHGFDRTASHMAGEYVDTAQPEPVAWMGSAGLGYDKNKYLSIPLYTAPPKREWQGLTDDDVAEVERWVEFKEAGSGQIAIGKLVRYIELKLRSKNNAV